MRACDRKKKVKLKVGSTLRSIEWRGKALLVCDWELENQADPKGLCAPGRALGPHRRGLAFQARDFCCSEDAETHLKGLR